MQTYQFSILLFVLCMVISAVGFRKLVYFISIGYAFSVVGMALASGLIYRSQLSVLALIQLLLLAVWGIRLGVYLYRRERQASYQRTAQAVADDYGTTTLWRKILIWVGVSLLYVVMFFPALLHAAGDVPGNPIIEAAGLVVMAAGLLLEDSADRQKSIFKERNPGSFVDAGLYRWVRCPNYLGEILFWVGSWLAGVAFFSDWLEWVLSLAGLVCIVLIMLGSTRRLELSQEARYGHLPEYQEYVKTVPVLFPWAPVYSLKKWKIYLG